MSVPGFQFDYTDQNTGVNYSTAWFVIKESKLDSPSLTKPATRCVITYIFYASQTAFENGMSPIDPPNYLIVSSEDGSSNWETYFDQSVMSQADHDLMTQSYAFLQYSLNNP